MILKSISAHRVGPFLEPFTVQLDERVTVLIGANDAGKSSLLRVIELALTNGAADEDFVNHDYIHSPSAGIWREDKSITVNAQISLTKSADLLQDGHRVDDTDVAVVTRIVAPDVASTRTHTQLRYHGGAESRQLRLPAIIKPMVEEGSEIRTIIDLKSPTRLEKSVLDAAFNGSFDLVRLQAQNSLNFTRSINGAKDILNKLIQKALPDAIRVKFELSPIEGDRSKLGVYLLDRHDGLTPFGLRGSGIRRIITLISELVTMHRDAGHRLVLLDEPEHTLHADAQHLLREFLFALTEDRRTQVVIATHSSAMVNPMRPEQVRVLVREKCDGTGTTRLLPKPTDSNFLGVRTCLGMNATDSLLFAPVTIITEGDTEVACFPKLIEKIETKLAPLNVRKLLGLSTFLDGNGDEFEYLCRLAKAHGSRVVIFLDGDKRRRLEQAQVAKKHPDVPIVLLPDSSEFEELVPNAVYLRALAKAAKIDLPVDPSLAIQQWVSNCDKRTRLAFSKRVEGWFLDTYDNDFPTKVSVMQEALKLATSDEINIVPVRELLQEVEGLLSKTSFA